MSFVPYQSNVFFTTPLECDQVLVYFGHLLDVGKWYYAQVSWDAFSGPFDSEAQANAEFQVYISQVRMCPGCEE